MASLPQEVEVRPFIRSRPVKVPAKSRIRGTRPVVFKTMMVEETESAEAKPLPTTPTPPPRRWCWRMPFLASRPEIPICEPLDFLQFQRLEEKNRRAIMPGHFEQLAIDRQLVMDCLRHYNSMHEDDEYEPAPGRVTRHFGFGKGICWTHGNFVARHKRSGCCSFLPAPRTIFFFELAFRDGFDGVVTCTPLDEPVTEAYSILGFPLWWSTRRDGRLDCICKTCDHRMDVYRPDLKRRFACGHREVEKACTMCFSCCNVLHPSPGEIVFRGYEDPTSD